ncbi:putative bifunctional diguanylate cyclase/phosphodiesterase [Comamonas fluminis]|uniref:putative bifunctional diguanylate cyclase/phosphodiesterase n=1 Tax=Comamonas fluminis TaxID=2796366 RepID=UPI001C45577A|nr:GGDEF domain-containing phosphodiesterase [Comamonas fluminis]
MQGHLLEFRNRQSMRHVLRFACLWMSGLSLVLTAAALLSPKVSWALAVLCFLLLPVALVTRLMVKARRWQMASLFFVWTNWVLVVATILASGGMVSKATIAFPVWVVITAWLLGASQVVGMLLLSTLTLVGLWGFDTFNVTESRSFPLTALIYVLGMLGLALISTLIARASLSRREQKSLDMLASLEASQHELRKFQRAVEQHPESIVITDPEQKIVYVNEAFLKRTGYARDEVLDQLTENVSTVGLTGANRQKAMEQLLSGEVWSGEMTNSTRDGASLRESVIVAPIRTPQGEVVNYVELKRDLSERMLAARRIHDLVYLDSLTGLPNRYSLALHLRALAHSKQRACHGLLLLDMDSFSLFNDVHGMQHSDELVHAIGARLVDVLPEDVWVGRIAAAEFAILFENLDASISGAEDQLNHYTRILKKAVQRPFSLLGWNEAESVSCCMGGAVMEPDADAQDNSDVLRFASVALHDAKQNGPGSVRLFEPRMAEDMIKRVRIAKDLRNGIPLGELRLFLQTQADARGHCVGAEVLVRWQHPQWGLVSPVEFIPIAEESELILRLGEWVMRQSCVLLAQPAFADRGLRLSVNISAIQFGHEEFMPMLKNVLRETGANPHQLTLEITEGVVLRDMNAARNLVQELRDMGIEIALDDFGTGYSSMYSLKHLPIQELKIDQSFVRGSHRSDTDAVMVEAMLLIAKRLKLRVVAEGVELQEQAEQLMQWSPDIVLQGLLLGKPIPQQQWLEEVLGEQPSASD